MTHSMTGFAAATGQQDDWHWSWELRSVNGRGLDLRLRIPDWIEGLEPALRSALQKAIARGSVSLSLRVTREVGSGDAAISPDGLDRALRQIEAVETAAMDRGMTLKPATAADILALRGAQEVGGERDGDVPALKSALLAALPDLLSAFNAARASEGAALVGVLGGQLDSVETLVKQAAKQAAERTESAADRLRANVARVMEAADGLDEARLTQEIALLAVKSDITEEIDRLRAHVTAGRDLLGGQGPVGRKLDFLIQEFNREANTLCSKAQSAALTATGLDLKSVIDQMREQVQNLE